MNVADARGLTFACKPGCGFCCTASPLVLPHEAPRPQLAPRVTRLADGTLRIPIAGPACSALQGDRRCGVYDERPSVCHLYPYSVHAGRRIQVTVTLACPGIEQWHRTDMPDTYAPMRAYYRERDPSGRARDTDAAYVEHPFGVAERAEDGAARAAELALAQPGAREMAERAKATFSEFDRRMKEWGVAATADRLRAAYLPHADALAQPATLPPLLAALEAGELVLEGNPARAVGALFDAEPENDIIDLLLAGAAEAFDEPETVIWVEPDLAWTSVAWTQGRARLVRHGIGARDIDVEGIPLAWDDDARAVLATYLARLMHRDHAEGAAAWLVDASGYQATPAAAFGRVLAEASLQVMLRAGLLAADEGRDAVDVAYARRGVMAYETAFHSLPTLGSIL